MKSITDESTKTIWYYSESGFPTYMAITEYRRRNPSYEHCIASRNTWESLLKRFRPDTNRKRGAIRNGN